jgi:hypothetical protein
MNVIYHIEQLQDHVGRLISIERAQNCSDGRKDHLCWTQSKVWLYRGTAPLDCEKNVTLRFVRHLGMWRLFVCASLWPSRGVWFVCPICLGFYIISSWSQLLSSHIIFLDRTKFHSLCLAYWNSSLGVEKCKRKIIHTLPEKKN